MTRNLNRLEGRLFTQGGTLFMVVHADEANDTAQVSYRVNDETQVLDLPFSEAAARVAGGANLILDNLKGCVPVCLVLIVCRVQRRLFQEQRIGFGSHPEFNAIGSSVSHEALVLDDNTFSF